MKLSKRFLYFLIILQVLIILGHRVFYWALLTFFPGLLRHQVGLGIAILVLSVSFLTLTIVTFKRDAPFLRFLEILSALWMPIWIYLLMASFVTIVIGIIFPGPLQTTGLVCFGVAVAFSVYGIINARLVRVVTIKVKLPNLPDYWRGKTGVMVSDLHLGHILRHGFARKVINKINGLNPEIVFIVGDLFDGVKADFVGLANEFKNIKSPRGIYFVSGNHEEFAGYQECERAIRGAGINILENQKVELNGLQVAGLAYFSESREKPEGVVKLIESLNLDPLKPSILLKHVPNHVAAIATTGISLQFSGHTHRGQVWPGRHFTKRAYKGFDYGLKSVGDYQIYTSSGVGTWGPPMRTLTNSEIVRVEFE